MDDYDFNASDVLAGLLIALAFGWLLSIPGVARAIAAALGIFLLYALIAAPGGPSAQVEALVAHLSGLASAGLLSGLALGKLAWTLVEALGKEGRKRK